MDVLKVTEDNMKAGLEHLKEELKGIRTGHANPAMLDKFTIEVYGSPMRLRDIANVTAPESRQLLITPYDPSNTAAIGKSIEASDSGFRPIVDANVVRINIPQMDASIRAEMVKLCHRKREEAKVSIRNVRREGNDTVKKQKSAGDITEDAEKKLEKQIQELTDKYCKFVDEIAAAKEKEVSTI